MKTPPPSLRHRFSKDVSLVGWRTPSGPEAGSCEPSGAQRPLFDWLVRLARENERRHAQRLAKLHTRAGVLRYATRLRTLLRRTQGVEAWPARTPLRPRVTPAFRGDGFCVEHIVLESRPDFFVTANLYLPVVALPPFPAVLFCCGHSFEAKAFPPYQRMVASLAQLGFAVLIFDPPGQGERDEYVDRKSGQRTVSRACRAHGAAGLPAYLLGRNFGAHRLWDAIRCVDYLQLRPDIDSRRVGATGSSGGGWEALWLAALDPRIRAVHANCAFSTFRRRIENRAVDAEPDPEQDPFGLLSQGIEASDLLLACAPRPVSLSGTTRDIFPLDGLRTGYREARQVLRRIGLAKHLALTVAKGGHCLTPAARSQTYRWMCRCLQNTELPLHHDPAQSIAPEPATWCTKTGIVLTSLGGKSTAEYNAVESCRLARTRPQLTPAAWRKLLTTLLDVPACAPHALVRSACAASGGTAVQLLEFHAPGRPVVTARLWRPSGRGRYPAILVARAKPADFAWRTDPFCRELAAAGIAALDLDAAGLEPLHEVWLDYVPLVEAQLTYDALLLGKSLAGLRTADILLAAAWLCRDSAVCANRLAVYGRGSAALPALFAAILDPRIRRVVEDAPPANLASLAENREYAWTEAVIVPGLLQHGDLPDLRAALAPRRIRVVSPRDHLNRPQTAAAFRAGGVTGRQASHVSSAAGPAVVTGADVAAFLLDAED